MDLSSKQYSAADKYKARIALTTRFRTNPVSRLKWIFDRFPKSDGLRILELGSGTGLFWLANRAGIRPSWTITLSDYSAGMLAECRSQLVGVKANFDFEVIDARNIGHPDGTFDLVLANNMLYHLDKRESALEGMRRVLKSRGMFVASTLGDRDNEELDELLYDFLSAKGRRFRFRASAFSMENGFDQLRRVFRHVEVERYEDSLSIDEAKPIVDYYLSFNDMYEGLVVLPDEYAAEFEEYLSGILRERGRISASKRSGVFVCERGAGDRR